MQIAVSGIELDVKEVGYSHRTIHRTLYFYYFNNDYMFPVDL